MGSQAPTLASPSQDALPCGPPSSLGGVQRSPRRLHRLRRALPQHEPERRLHGARQERRQARIPESPAAAPMDLLPEPEEGRSSYARGRALTFGIAENQEEDKVVEMLEIEEEEAEKGELEEVSVAVSVGVRRPNVATTPTDEEEEIAAEVLIDRSKVELLTFRNKIGIFIGVVMIVLTISVVLGMISVSLRRARRGKRMMKEDEISQADTVSTVMETSSYTGLPDSVYSNCIRKSSLSCDELTELDNDSFLTSLETISVMDRFGWD